jgi:ribosomal protein L40E
MSGSGTAKKPRTIRTRLLAIAISVVSILVGLYILTNQTFVASAIQPYIGSALGAPGPAADGLVPYGSLSYVVYAVGFGLIASGGAMLRMMFRSSMVNLASGGPAMGGLGMSPEAMQNALTASMARIGTAAAPTPQVKVKCRNCGSLEEEDAAYCRKCGKPI